MGGYGRSKAAVEELCRSRLARGGRTWIARPFTIVGEGQRADMAVARWTAALLAGKPLQLFAPLDASRDVTDVRDMCSVLTRLAELPGKGGVVNVGTGVSRTLGEIIATLALVTQTTPRLVHGAHVLGRATCNAGRHRPPRRPDGAPPRDAARGRRASAGRGLRRVVSRTRLAQRARHERLSCRARSARSPRKWSSSPLQKQRNRAAARFSKPSDGLEPATPSLPSRPFPLFAGIARWGIVPICRTFRTWRTEGSERRGPKAAQEHRVSSGYGRDKFEDASRP